MSEDDSDDETYASLVSSVQSTVKSRQAAQDDENASTSAENKAAAQNAENIDARAKKGLKRKLGISQRNPKKQKPATLTAPSSPDENDTSADQSGEESEASEEESEEEENNQSARCRAQIKYSSTIPESLKTEKAAHRLTRQGNLPGWGHVFADRAGLADSLRTLIDPPASSSSQKTSRKNIKLAPDNPSVLALVSKCQLRPKLALSWQGHRLKSRAPDTADSSSTSSKPALLSLQNSLLGSISKYTDLWFPGRTPSNAQALMEVYAVHIANHILQSRDITCKNDKAVSARDDALKERKTSLAIRKREERNAKRLEKKNARKPGKKAQATARLQETQDVTPIPEVDEDAIKDQGFTRAKVLVLVPFRHAARSFVSTLLKILPPHMTSLVKHKGRFEKEFGGNEKVITTRNGKTLPEDYVDNFGLDSDDCFRVGIQFNRKNVGLYSDFFQSDIIVASPMGLKMIENAQGREEKDFDFLSSIEILCIDRADVFGMQNFEHLRSVLSSLNKIPYQTANTDFSRVRPSCLNGEAKFFRQNLIFSAYCTPELNSLFNRNCLNADGRIKIRPQYNGVLSQIVGSTKQVFMRLPAASAADGVETKFAHFSKTILPQLKQTQTDHVLIFVPSYFDFVRVRNYMKSQKLQFGLASEYTKQSHLARARSNFFHGVVKYLVTTERFHFYHRYKLRGIKHLVFYGIPTHPVFYAEYLNAAKSNEDNSCVALYTKYDSLELERVVGSRRASSMLSSQNSVHMFC